MRTPRRSRNTGAGALRAPQRRPARHRRSLWRSRQASASCERRAVDRAGPTSSTNWASCSLRARAGPPDERGGPVRRPPDPPRPCVSASWRFRKLAGRHPCSATRPGMVPPWATSSASAAATASLSTTVSLPATGRSTEEPRRGVELPAAAWPNQDWAGRQDMGDARALRGEWRNGGLVSGDDLVLVGHHAILRQA